MRYIGSKALLLENIEEMLEKHIDGSEEVFLDLFAGTNIVGNYFKKKYRIISNDILYFSYVNAMATIVNNKPLEFKGLINVGIDDPLEYLKGIPVNTTNEGSSYYEHAYSPTGKTMYFSVDNAKRIDLIREKIDEWYKESIVTKNEYYYLLSTLIESIPYVSNITGTYGAYLKFWDKRALKSIELRPFEVVDNGKDNEAYNEDANTLVKELGDIDIVYIDTPYNTRQYASNYHVLENICRNNKPELKGKTKIFDWSKLKSDYSTKSKAFDAMSNLLDSINAKHVIISYSDDGIIPIDKLIELLKEKSVDGKVDIKEIEYRKYKSKIGSKKAGVSEWLFYIKRSYNKKNVVVKNDEKILDVKTWKMAKNKYIKSPLNYIGGKYKLLNQIIPLFPQNIDTFVDLFSGGGNVGINIKANKVIFNDMNNKVNEMFNYFSKLDIEDLVKQIKGVIYEFNLSKDNEEGYLNLRKKYNENPNPLYLYTLICYGYNYQIRFNNSMKFNNPFGRNRSHFSKNMENNLRNFMEELNKKNVNFTDFLFEDFNFESLGENDFVYLDPPYLITRGSYNDGNRGFHNWNETQEIKMYKLLDFLTKNDVRWALSNVIEHKGRVNQHLNNFIKENNYVYVNYLNYDYSNSSHNTSRGASSEVLITNYDVDTYKITN